MAEAEQLVAGVVPRVAALLAVAARPRLRPRHGDQRADHHGGGCCVHAELLLSTAVSAAAAAVAALLLSPMLRSLLTNTNQHAISAHLYLYRYLYTLRTWHSTLDTKVNLNNNVHILITTYTDRQAYLANVRTILSSMSAYLL